MDETKVCRGERVAGFGLLAESGPSFYSPARESSEFWAGMKSLLRILFLWWHGPTLGTWVTTLFSGSKVGEDGFGNRYYESAKGRRWVIYNGTVEASRVPAEWHGWLHHTFAEPPTTAPLKAKAWEAPHLPNQSGTSGAYRPPGSLARGGVRSPATGDYQAWKPE